VAFSPTNSDRLHPSVTVTLQQIIHPRRRSLTEHFSTTSEQFTELTNSKTQDIVQRQPHVRHLALSRKLSLRYGNFTIFKMADVCHIEF